MRQLQKMRQLQRQAGEFAEHFSTAKKAEAQFIDLVEEVGELAQIVLSLEGLKKSRNKAFTKADLEHEMADILFDLFLIANHYNVDLEDAYSAMIKKLKKRVQEGEFKGR